MQSLRLVVLYNNFAHCAVALLATPGYCRKLCQTEQFSAPSENSPQSHPRQGEEYNNTDILRAATEVSSDEQCN